MGGMSFHGGVIGTSIGILYLAGAKNLHWLRLHDYCLRRSLGDSCSDARHS